MSRFRHALFAFLFVAPAVVAAETDPHALLVKADRVRNAWTEAILRLRVSTAGPGATPASALIEVAIKGGDRARITFLDPKDAGKFVISRGDESWLILPGTRNPVKIPRSHRVRGGFGAADISKTRFADEYDAVVEREEVLDGRTCDVLRLLARKDRNPSFPVVRMWVDRKESLYRKAIFLVASGKTAKETTFDEYRTFRGVLSLAKMTIVDALKPGTTVVEYLDYEKATLPDTLFEPRPAPAP